VVVVVVMKMIFDEDILALLNVALYPFFAMPEKEIPANCVIICASLSCLHLDAGTGGRTVQGIAGICVPSSPAVLSRGIVLK